MDFSVNQITTNQKPILKTYLNIVAFFNDYFKYRKKIDSSFSYEVWALELGFKSKATARMICQGQRNITDTFLNSFSSFENLSSDDQDYLQLLNFYQMAKTTTLKKCLLEKIIEKFDISQSQQNVKNYIKFLSSIDIPIIQLLISFDDFVATENNLMSILQTDITALQKNLKILEELDLIKKLLPTNLGETRWITKNKLFKIPGEISDPALALFHQETMCEALNKACAISKEHKFRTLYFSLDEESFNDIILTLNDIANRLKVKYCNNYINDKKLYKFNFQLYPVTDKVCF